MQLSLDCYKSLPSIYVAVLAVVTISLFASLCCMLREIYHLVRHPVIHQATIVVPSGDEYAILRYLKGLVLRSRLFFLTISMAAVVIIGVFQADYCFGFSLTTGQRTVLARFLFLLAVLFNSSLAWHVSIIPDGKRFQIVFRALLLATWLPAAVQASFLIAETAARFPNDRTCAIVCDRYVLDALSNVLVFVATITAAVYVWAKAAAMKALGLPIGCEEAWGPVLVSAFHVCTVGVLHVCVKWIEGLPLRSYDRTTFDYTYMEQQDTSWHVTSFCFALSAIASCIYWTRQHIRFREQSDGITDIIQLRKVMMETYIPPTMEELAARRAQSLLSQTLARAATQAIDDQAVAVTAHTTESPATGDHATLQTKTPLSPVAEEQQQQTDSAHPIDVSDGLMAGVAGSLGLV